MGTSSGPDSAASALFGKTRREVLALLFGRPDDAFYLRQLVRAVGAGTGAVQRELAQLSAVGLIVREPRGNQVYYQANRASPLFVELNSLFIKTAGAADLLRAALAPLTDRIDFAFIYGSFATGRQRAGSDLDLMVVGDVPFDDVVAAIVPIENRLGREVNPTVYPPAEFRDKLTAGHHFLRSVALGPKILLLGGERDLVRLAR